MRHDSIRKYIAEQQLTSNMNNTKWKELIKEITSDTEYDPRVNIKYLMDKDNNGKFSTVWWDEVEQYGFDSIEWIEINPIKEISIGRLVAPKTIDYSDFIKKRLDKQTIPYEIIDGIFKVYGYKR